jgi:hypothetical protein
LLLYQANAQKTKNQQRKTSYTIENKPKQKRWQKVIEKPKTTKTYYFFFASNRKPQDIELTEL